MSCSKPMIPKWTHRYFRLRPEEDLLNAAIQSAPWLLRVLHISLPDVFVRGELREAYREFKSKLEPRNLCGHFIFINIRLR